MGTVADVKVELSTLARKQLVRLPEHIVRKFALWVDLNPKAWMQRRRSLGSGIMRSRGSGKGIVRYGSTMRIVPSIFFARTALLKPYMLKR
jgi:hypothetical protein